MKYCKGDKDNSKLSKNERNKLRQRRKFIRNNWEIKKVITSISMDCDYIVR